MRHDTKIYKMGFMYEGILDDKQKPPKKGINKQDTKTIELMEALIKGREETFIQGDQTLRLLELDECSPRWRKVGVQYSIAGDVMMRLNNVLGRGVWFWKLGNKHIFYVGTT